MKSRIEHKDEREVPRQLSITSQCISELSHYSQVIDILIFTNIQVTNFAPAGIN